MANLSELPTFDAGVYQIETSDPVLGGPNGIANAQAKALANRTAYLKQEVEKRPLPASTAPAALGFSAAVGTAVTAARADHVHPLPAIATASEAGLMSAEDKNRLDGMASGAAALGSTAGLALSENASAGTATTAARSDHAHPLPATATPFFSGLMSAADKVKLDGAPSNADVAGMVAAHVAETDPHSQYAKLASPVFTGAPTAPTPAQFDRSTKLATTEFVKLSGLRSSGVNYVSANTILTAAALGSTVIGQNASPITITLPLLSTCPTGTRIEFLNPNSNSITVSRQGADSIDTGRTIVTSFVLNTGDTLTLVSGNGIWSAIGGSVQLGYSALFGVSHLGTGYLKMPNEIILQWGSLNSTPGSASFNANVIFPIAFSTACYRIVASIGTQTVDLDYSSPYRTDRQGLNVGMPTLTGCEMQGFCDNNLSNTRIVQWIAIGK